MIDDVIIAARKEVPGTGEDLVNSIIISLGTFNSEKGFSSASLSLTELSGKVGSQLRERGIEISPSDFSAALDILNRFDITVIKSHLAEEDTIYSLSANGLAQYAITYEAERV